MSDYKKEIMEEWKDSFIASDEEQAYDAYPYNIKPFIHEEVTKFLSQALTRIEQKTREEEVKRVNNYFYHLRIKNQIRQVHMASRKLSEAEVKAVPDWAWVDEYYMDTKWSLKSWLKQYEHQKSLISPSEEKESDCGCCELKHNLPPVNLMKEVG